MFKKIILFLLLALMIVGCSTSTVEEDNCNDNKGCDIADTTSTLKTLNFEESYESLNGKTTNNGKTYRTVNLDDNGNFVLLDLEKYTNIPSKEINFSGILFVSDPKCPWCRSIIETAVKVANEMNVQNIYTIHAWDENGNELFRDKYVQSGSSYVLETGHPLYSLLINGKGNELLQDYNITKDDGSSFPTGEKRIYLPSFLYVENNEIKAFTTGISELQKDAYEELTDAMLKDTEKQLKEFFSKVR